MVSWRHFFYLKFKKNVQTKEHKRRTCSYQTCKSTHVFVKTSHGIGWYQSILFRHDNLFPLLNLDKSLVAPAFFFDVTHLLIDSKNYKYFQSVLEHYEMPYLQYVELRGLYEQRVRLPQQGTRVYEVKCSGCFEVTIVSPTRPVVELELDRCKNIKYEMDKTKVKVLLSTSVEDLFSFPNLEYVFVHTNTEVDLSSVSSLKILEIQSICPVVIKNLVVDHLEIGFDGTLEDITLSNVQVTKLVVRSGSIPYASCTSLPEYFGWKLPHLQPQTRTLYLDHVPQTASFVFHGRTWMTCPLFQPQLDASTKQAVGILFQGLQDQLDSFLLASVCQDQQDFAWTSVMRRSFEEIQQLTKVLDVQNKVQDSDLDERLTGVLDYIRLRSKPLRVSNTPKHTQELVSAQQNEQRTRKELEDAQQQLRVLQMQFEQTPTLALHEQMYEQCVRLSILANVFCQRLDKLFVELTMPILENFSFLLENLFCAFK